MARSVVMASVLLLVLVARDDRAAAAMPMAVIVNPQNDVSDLKLDQLADAVLGRSALWPNGRRVTVVLREPGSPERASALLKCCRLTPERFQRHIVQAVFQGDVNAEPKVVTSAAWTKKFVANVPGAIGFVPLSEVDETVKVVRIGGRAPTDAGYALILP